MHKVVIKLTHKQAQLLMLEIGPCLKVWPKSLDLIAHTDLLSSIYLLLTKKTLMQYSKEKSYKLTIAQAVSLLKHQQHSLEHSENSMVFVLSSSIVSSIHSQITNITHG